MPLDLYLAFVLASAVLILIPGPNVTLVRPDGYVAEAGADPSAVWRRTAGLLWSQETSGVGSVKPT